MENSRKDNPCDQMSSQALVVEWDVLSYILHLADYIATKGGIGYDNDDVLYQLEEGAMDFLGFKQDDVREIMQQAMESAIQL
jgi:hypothetical protein